MSTFIIFFIIGFTIGWLILVYQKELQALKRDISDLQRKEKRRYSPAELKEQRERMAAFNLRERMRMIKEADQEIEDQKE